MELLSQEGIAGAQRPHPPGVTSPCPEELPADKKHFSSLHEAEELAGPFGGAPGPETPKSDTQVRKPSPACTVERQRHHLGASSRIPAAIFMSGCNQ